MQVYEIIEGIKISVYSNDHLPPHVHAQIGEYEALISIREQSIVAGYLPSAKERKAVQFVKKNSSELIELFYALNPQIKKI